MDNNVSVEELKLNELENIFYLYEECFGKEKMEAWIKRFEWEFINNPRTKQSASKLWVAKNNNEIIGFLGSFPMLLKIKDRVIITSSSGDLMVSPKSRKMGVGEILLKTYLESCDLLATDGFGYQPVTGRILRRLGFRAVFCEKIFLRPFDVSQLYEFMISSGRLPAFLNNKLIIYLSDLSFKLCNKVLTRYSMGNQSSHSNELIIEEVDEVNDEINQLWEESSSYFPIIFVRDKEFIKWRFLDDPLFKHNLFIARNKLGKLVGYIDLRISNKRNMRIARIMDMFCNPYSYDVIDALVIHAIIFAQRNNLALLTCMGMHPLIQMRIRKYLYVRARNEEIPALLYGKSEEGFLQDIYNAEMWHVTSADGDEGFAG